MLNEPQGAYRDNPQMESCFGSLETELDDDGLFKTRLVERYAFFGSRRFL